jgi:hypothetical protein
MKVHAVVYSEATQDGEIASWQCVYCGSVCEQTGPKTWKVTHRARIVLQPGELENMRETRATRRDT